MGARRRLTQIARLAALASFAAFASVASGGCKPKAAPPPPPAPAASRDHLAKGEVAEGAQRAFTFPLPLHSRVKARFEKSVHVVSPLSIEDLASFTRARVKDGKASAGAAETRFDDVVVVKDPSRVLMIEIRTVNNGESRSQMVVSDVTPIPIDPNESDADRWRKAGLTPDGKLLDPKSMQ